MDWNYATSFPESSASRGQAGLLSHHNCMSLFLIINIFIYIFFNIFYVYIHLSNTHTQTHTHKHTYRHTSFYCVSQILCSLEIEGVWQLCIYICTIFLRAFDNFMSLCHIWQFSKYFKLFHYYFICYGDL